MESPRPSKRRVLTWAKVLVSLGLLAWLGTRMVQRDGVGALVERLGSLHIEWLAVAIALHFAAVLAGVSRWQLLLRGAALDLPFVRLLRSFLIGRFIGAFTPSTTGLDGWRLYDIGRTEGALGRSAAVIVVEKLAGLIGMALVCAALTPFGAVELMGPSAFFAAASLGGASLLGLVVIQRLGRGAPPARLARLGSRLPRRLKAKLSKVHEALSKSRPDRGQLLGAVAYGVMSHLALSTVFLATAWAVGVDAPIGTLLIVGNAIVLAVLLPVSVGGVGVREGVAVLLLAVAGVSSTDAVLVALLGYLTGQVPALLGGLAMLRDRKLASSTESSPAQA